MSLSKDMLRFVIVASLAFGCVMGASMIKLWDTGASVGGASDLAQWTKLSLFYAAALLCPHVEGTYAHALMRRLTVLSCLALPFCLISLLLFTYVDPAGGLFDGILEFRGVFGILQGVLECCLTVVVIYLVSSLPPKHSSVAVTIGLAFNMAVLALQPILSTPQIMYLRCALWVGGIICSFVGISLVAGLPEMPHPVRPAVTANDRERTMPHFLMFVICAAVLTMMYGYLRRMTLHYEYRFGTDPVGGAVLLLVVLLVVVYACVRGISLSGDHAIYVLAPLICAAYILVAVLPPATLLVADILAGSCYTILRLLLWVNCARVTWAHPDRLFKNVALVSTASVLGLQIGFQVAQWDVVSGGVAVGREDALVATVLALGCCVAVTLGNMICDAVGDAWKEYEVHGGDEDAGETPGLAGADGSIASPHGSGLSAPTSAVPRAQEGLVTDDAGRDAVRDRSVLAVGPNARTGSPVPTRTVPFRAEPRNFSEYFGLSARETQILGDAIRGYNASVVGEKLGLSANTVRTYLRRIYVKTGVGSKQELLALLDDFSARVSGEE